MKVKFYYRQGCHLCDDMLELLQRYQQSHGLTILSFDIEDDELLEQQYRLKIPVLLQENGEEICHYFFDKKAFELYLDA